MITPAPKPPKTKKPDPSLRKYGTPEFKAWIHGQPCVLCGITRPIQQAHVGKHPMGKKLDWTHTVPLCGPFVVGRYQWEGCHARFDQKKLDAADRARVLMAVGTIRAAWQAHSGDRA